MKVLSLLQPWASLMAWGYKTIETRSWGTSYRGPFAVHASMGKKGPWRASELEQMFRDAGVAFPEFLLGNLPFGCIVSVHNLFNVDRMTPELIAATTRQEFTFGDWRPRRYAWRTDGARRIANPIPFKGSLGLRDLPSEVEAVALARCA